MGLRYMLLNELASDGRFETSHDGVSHWARPRRTGLRTRRRRAVRRHAGERACRGPCGRRGDERGLDLAVDDNGSVAAPAEDPNLLVADAVIRDGVLGWALSALYFHV